MSKESSVTINKATDYKDQRQLWWWCDDKCEKVNAQRNLKFVTFNLAYVFQHASPDTVKGMFEAVELLQKMSLLVNAANVGGAVGNAAKLLELSKAIIDDQTSGTLTDAAIDGIKKIQNNLMKTRGAAIWIKLSGECCLNERCCLIKTRLNWVEVEGWHKCTIRPDPNWPFGFKPDDKKGILNALPKCIIEAVKTWKCPHGFKRKGILDG